MCMLRHITNHSEEKEGQPGDPSTHYLKGVSFWIQGLAANLLSFQMIDRDEIQSPVHHIHSGLY